MKNMAGPVWLNTCVNSDILIGTKTDNTVAMNDKWTKETLDTARSDEKKSQIAEIPVTMETSEIKDNFVPELLLDTSSLRTIGDLSLCSKELTHLPEDFGYNLTNLTRLNLSKNKLKNVPTSLKLLAKLEQLFLNHNLIRYLPLTVTEISYLRVLDLSNNCLTALPESIANLELLETLVLSSNKLTQLPSSCRKMNRLKVLDLSANSLKHIPLCVVNGMRALETLDLSSNVYINMSLKPASENLKKLYAREALCNVKFPIWIFGKDAPSLEILDLDGTSFKLFNFPENCCNLKIKKLSLRCCAIYDSFLQKMLSLTNELVSLKVGNGNALGNGNSFWSMSIDTLKNPKLVKEIDMRFTGLPAVCRSIGNFKNLVKLNIGCNSLNRLSNEICLLKNLEILIIDENLLVNLPNNIGEMISLVELKANKNNLAELPESFGQLKNILYVDLYENDFENLPKKFNSMNNLVGLDLDKNNIDINDFRIGGSDYEAMRRRLRNRYDVGCVRETGRRYERNIEEQSDTSSDNSSVVSSAEIKEFVDEAVEENWDISDDSADEFDPTCDDVTPSARIKTIKFDYKVMVAQSFFFCPADLHQPPIKRKIAELQEKGILKPNYTDTIVEGQFDDAD